VSLPKTTPKPRTRYFVGVRKLDARREVFAVLGEFKLAKYRTRYALAVGPFANPRAAHFVARYGGNAPAFRCADDPAKVCRGKPLSPRKTLDLPSKTTGQYHAGEHPYDLIDRVLDEVGGIPRKPKGMTGEKDTLFAGYDRAAKSGILALLPKAQTRPDAVAEAVGLTSAEDLWNALADAALARKGTRSGHRTEKSLLDQDAEAAESFARSAACSLQFGPTSKPTKAGRLKVGDKFTVAGEPFTVKTIDRENLQVVVEDGRRFGLQRIPDTFKLCADPGSLKRTRRPRSKPQPENEPF